MTPPEGEAGAVTPPERLARDLKPAVVVGLMSGTSADGMDTVTVRLQRVAGRLEWEVLGRGTREYPADVADDIRRAMDPASSDVLLLTQLHQRIGQEYAATVAAAQQQHRVDLVGLSGQTVYHVPRVEPDRGWHTKSTLQLGEAAVVAERCNVVTVSDFRQSDIAAGGQGAPLVPFSDHLLYSRPGIARVVVNIGGIANVTYLPADGRPDGVLAFDTGPGNCLMDEAAQAHLSAPRDDDGTVAASGDVDAAALERLLAEPYFGMQPPKTTGREHFHLRHAMASGWPEGFEGRPQDLLATLSELTARTVASAIRGLTAGQTAEVLVAGGGARNPELMRRLRSHLSTTVMTFADLGYDDKDRETLAMAVMAYMAVNGEPNVLPSATGAKRAVVAGKVSNPTPTANA